ncbi:unnamed protein product [Musa acuminata subsp. malaccensis]|uniref:(wild Malaysian banana) hypothetical protein n=1 Tax=Musa acuminata subsp. malaccensis TaxID=214687 RepID=A0A804JLP1_MUSAM|nr:unnamed protein product [Musa acuminata subsp. malaccensis]
MYLYSNVHSKEKILWIFKLVILSKCSVVDISFGLISGSDCPTLMQIWSNRSPTLYMSLSDVALNEEKSESRPYDIMSAEYPTKSSY